MKGGWVWLRLLRPGPSLPRAPRRLCKWTPKAKIKALMDPGVAQVQKLVTSLRKSAKDDRVLLHYCGLGVPRPTPSGDLWVFNKDYTEVRRLRAGGLGRLRAPAVCSRSSSVPPPLSPPLAVRASAAALSPGLGPGGPRDPHL